MSSSGPNLESMDLDAEENLADEILSMSTQDIQARTRLMDNEVILKSRGWTDGQRNSLDINLIFIHI